MIRLARTWVVVTCAALAVSASALAQTGRPYQDPAAPHAPVAGRVTSGIVIPAPQIDLSGMLVPLNQIRKQVGVGALAWSPELAEQSSKIATSAAQACTYSSAQKALGATPSIFYWAAGIGRIDGKTLAQDLTTSFVVAEWRRGGSDYNPATGVCRQAGACKTYSRIATPLSKSVGCARAICPSQSQIWVCKFDDN